MPTLKGRSNSSAKQNNNKVVPDNNGNKKWSLRSRYLEPVVHQADIYPSSLMLDEKLPYSVLVYEKPIFFFLSFSLNRTHWYLRDADSSSIRSRGLLPGSSRRLWFEEDCVILEKRGGGGEQKINNFSYSCTPCHFVSCLLRAAREKLKESQ